MTAKKENKRSKSPVEIVLILEKYFGELRSAVQVCVNAARYALIDAAELGSLNIHLNMTELSTRESFKALIAIFDFKIPTLIECNDLTLAADKIALLIENIDAITNFLSSIPKVEVPKTPSDYREQKEILLKANSKGG